MERQIQLGSEVYGNMRDKMADSDTFVEITNKNIYDKLIQIEKHVLKTNGKVKLNRWIATTSLGLVTLVIGYMINIH